MTELKTHEGLYWVEKTYLDPQKQTCLATSQQAYCKNCYDEKRIMTPVSKLLSPNRTNRKYRFYCTKCNEIYCIEIPYP